MESKPDNRIDNAISILTQPVILNSTERANPIPTYTAVQVPALTGPRAQVNDNPGTSDRENEVAEEEMSLAKFAMLKVDMLLALSAVDCMILDPNLSNEDASTEIPSESVEPTPGSTDATLPASTELAIPASNDPAVQVPESTDTPVPESETEEKQMDPTKKTLLKIKILLGLASIDHLKLPKPGVNPYDEAMEKFTTAHRALSVLEVDGIYETGNGPEMRMLQRDIYRRVVILNLWMLWGRKKGEELVYDSDWSLVSEDGDGDRDREDRPIPSGIPLSPLTL